VDAKIIDEMPQDHAKDWSHWLFGITEVSMGILFLILITRKSTRPCALQVFHKVTICCWLSATITSILVLVTAVPDAEGGQRCMRHLQDAKMWNWMNEDHTSFEVLLESIKMGRITKPTSCGISFGGFCQFLLIFFLGLFEWSLLFLRKRFWKECERKGKLCHLVKFYALAVICLLFVSVFVVYSQKYEQNQFHYTMDAVMTISLVLLLYTNAPVTVAAKWWSGQHLDDEGGDRKELRQHLKTNLNSDGDIFIPPCCVPFCCMWGRYHVYGDNKVRQVYKFLHGKDAKMSDEIKMQMSMQIQKANTTKAIRVPSRVEEGRRKSSNI